MLCAYIYFELNSNVLRLACMPLTTKRKQLADTVTLTLLCDTMLACVVTLVWGTVLACCCYLGVGHEACLLLLPWCGARCLLAVSQGEFFLLLGRGRGCVDTGLILDITTLFYGCVHCFTAPFTYTPLISFPSSEDILPNFILHHEVTISILTDSFFVC